MEKLVTAVITTYNRQMDMLRRAAVSVLTQSYKNIELIIVDDNRGESAYLSKEIKVLAEEFKELYPNDIYVLPTENGKHGGQAARNTGIHAAKGEYIAFLDDDDEWLCQKIEKQAGLLDKKPEVGLCFTKGMLVNECFTPPFMREFHRDNFIKRPDFRRLLRGDTIGTTSQAMVRRSVFEKVGCFDEEFPARQDYEMWLRIVKDFAAEGVPEVLFKYYISKADKAGQLTKNYQNCIRGHELIYEKYKEDIDRDRKAKFNVFFNIAHYYMVSGNKKEYLKYYIKSFFLSPVEFYKKGLIKLRIMQEKKKG